MIPICRSEEMNFRKHFNEDGFSQYFLNLKIKLKPEVYYGDI